MKPNFLIGGTAAGGTSFLYELLIQHPEIYLPYERIPEPHYYYKSWEYKKGLQWYLERYFSEAPKNKIAVGERSSSYLYGGRKIASRIAKDFPNMKFIFMLRNPIQRAWANYRFTALQGLETLSFEEAIKHEKQRVSEAKGIWKEIQPYDYTGRGFYARQLREFLEFFPKEQILCVKSEELSNDNLEPLYEIYRFLGLHNQSFVPTPSPCYTSLSVIDVKKQKELRDYFGENFAFLINSIRNEEIKVQKGGQEKYAALIKNIKSDKELMPKQCFSVLLEIFKEDMEELKGMVNFSIDDWGGGGKYRQIIGLIVYILFRDFYFLKMTWGFQCRY